MFDWSPVKRHKPARFDRLSRGEVVGCPADCPVIPPDIFKEIEKPLPMVIRKSGDDVDNLNPALQLSDLLPLIHDSGWITDGAWRVPPTHWGVLLLLRAFPLREDTMAPHLPQPPPSLFRPNNFTLLQSTAPQPFHLLQHLKSTKNCKWV